MFLYSLHTTMTSHERKNKQNTTHRKEIKDYFDKGKTRAVQKVQARSLPIMSKPPNFGNLGVLIISLNFFFFFFFWVFLGGRKHISLRDLKGKNWMYKYEVKLKNLEVVFPLHYFIHCEMYHYHRKLGKKSQSIIYSFTPLTSCTLVR